MKWTMLDGLTTGCRPAPQVLGRSGSRLVIDTEPAEPRVERDSGSKLDVFPLGDVFTERDLVLLGFGWPNVFIVTPDASGDKLQKLAAFMFMRKKSFVCDTKGRVQTGVFYQLRNLPPEAISALRDQMQAAVGKRSLSCARHAAKVLTAAGFTSGGKQLKVVARPSKLAALIWRRGLEWGGKPVDLRVVCVGSEVPDHFLRVWQREALSGCRSLSKKFAAFTRNAPKTRAPIFEPTSHVTASTDHWEGSPEVAVGISRPSLLGAYLSFLWGSQSFFQTRLPGSMATANPVLRVPLELYPGDLDRTTKTKKFIFTRTGIAAFLNRHLEAQIEQYHLPARAVVDMLRVSTGPDHDTAFLYNMVVRGHDIRIKRLNNRNGRDHKILNWIFAKHLLIAGLKPVSFAGELWCYRNECGQVVVCINNNSGTYKPGSNRLDVVGRYFEQFFGTKVVTASCGG